MPILLGCIADDFTGATDLANNLVRAGMRVVQAIGVPAGPLATEVDAVVVALKSRTIAPAEAVAQSLEALRWLQAQGARQIYFKYCSTFDSTPAGNIGPVTEGLMEALGCDFTIATPAFPQRANRVQGLPVCRRGAAQRERHAKPSAHADDRCQPGACAAGADAAQGGTDRPCSGGAWRVAQPSRQLRRLLGLLGEAMMPTGAASP